MPSLPQRLSNNRLAQRLAARRERPGRNLVVIDELQVSQTDTRLLVRMTFVPGTVPHALWGRPVGTDDWLRLADVSSEGEGYRAEIDLVVLAAQAPAPRPVVGDELPGEVFALHVEIDRTLHATSEVTRRFTANPEIEVSAPVDGRVIARYRRVLGTARHTEVGALDEITIGEHHLTPYVNARGGVSIAVDRPLNPFASVRLARLAVRRGKLRIRGSLDSRHGDVLDAEVLLKGRITNHRIAHPLPLRFDDERTAERFGQRSYKFDISLDCAAFISDPEFGDDTYDAWMRVHTAQHPEPFDVRFGRTRLLVRYLTRPGWAQHADRAVAVSPYFTFKAKRASFNVKSFDAQDFAYLRRQIALRHLMRVVHGRRQVWLIGERPDKAQDNGYWFFRYVRENHPEIEAYYVIERGSPERANVEPLGNVVDFGSREHMRLTLLADKIIGTHHADFLYPMRTKEFDRAVRATKIFLQHGVMGTKWMASLYGKWIVGFDTDLVIVSSEREREYLVTDFGYDLNEVAVTGLPRFDSLFAGDVPVKARQLLIMPTWRDWLLDLDAYPESEYHEMWSGMLHSKMLRDLVERHDLDVVFCLHTNMQQYRHLFTDTPVRVIGQGEVDVQRLLKESAMLVTDYSSVGFDFSFLHKPVAYFQFDREQFLGPPGSHLDLDQELPGPIFRSGASVLAEVQRRADAGFVMAPEYAERADRFITRRDRANSERVFDAVRRTRRGLRLRLRLRERLLGHMIVSEVPRVFRRHRMYFPIMRRLYRLVKLLPADPRLALFESGVGKQYADSPRYLYEDLVRTHPEITKVWAFNGRLPTVDPNTRVVERLSPRYFYYLARAKYWVNNQSFPHYVTRRRDGVYVQTWHGTPIKRMLHDLPVVHGRDSGYVERATTAAQQWSVLVSPNHYTSEIMRSAFRYTGDVLELGYPRNDVLHDPDRAHLAARVRARLGIRPDQRVILYAPTFRDDQVGLNGRFTFTLPFDLERIHAELGPDTVLLLRMHVLVASAFTIPPELRDAVRDVSKYAEIQELFLISDALITDYSSVFFDYASLGRPILFFAYDLHRYRDTLRGFYLDYETELPGPIVETEDDLIRALKDLDATAATFAQRQAAFVERFGERDDGHAAARVIDAVFGKSQAEPDDAAR